jgi:8-oxo-dGTP pyrophosphatase MutT (NUDIX family)
MIYLTNDTLDQAVYFELRGKEPHRRGNSIEHLHFGLLGNGVHEVAVTLRSRRGCVEIVFGKSELFSFVEEDAMRRMIREMVAGETVH